MSAKEVVWRLVLPAIGVAVALSYGGLAYHLGYSTGWDEAEYTYCQGEYEYAFECASSEQDSPSLILDMDDYRRRAVRHEAMRWGIDPELALAVSLVENWSGRPDAVSRVGAVGIMQVMPTVWTGRFDRECGHDLYDPRTNACYGVLILAFYLGNCRGDTDCALARYNGAITPSKAVRYQQLVAARRGEAAEWLGL